MELRIENLTKAYGKKVLAGLTVTCALNSKANSPGVIRDFCNSVA